MPRKWVDPLELAARIPQTEKCWILLYSGMKTDFTGGYSILAFGVNEEIKSGGFAEVEKKLSYDKSKFANAWFGYFGYGLKNSLEKLPQDKPGFIDMPDLWLINFRHIVVFNHIKNELEVFGEDLDFDLYFMENAAEGIPEIKEISSNMTKGDYLAKVKKIKDHIVAGDIYQANLTRKFFGNFSRKPSAFEIFKALSRASPAPYAAFMKMDENYIISSSPEMFLKIDESGNIETRPIKGSAADNVLALSEKDKAENLMIVDLMRNDLAQTSLPGSVKTQSLFDITEYKTIFHMSSTVTARKKPEVEPLEVVKKSFPPGSMTGTPKIKAMEICSEMEGMARGVYSGVLGWLGGDGSLELSVVIRTLIINGDRFEFQVGGAIVADSIPEKEWEETLLKAKGICQALGIKDLKF